MQLQTVPPSNALWVGGEVRYDFPGTLSPGQRALIFRMNAQRTVSVEASRSELCRTPNRLYLRETNAHTPASKLSEPLESVAGLPRQVFT
jgi:hypothetical protein